MRYCKRCWSRKFEEEGALIEVVKAELGKIWEGGGGNRIKAK